MKEEQTIRRDRSHTVSVQELQARLTALLFPASGDRAQAVPLTSRGKVVMVLVPWYHFQDQVRMDAARGGLSIITRPISSTVARRQSTVLHEQLLQLAQANGEALVALVIQRHQEQRQGHVDEGIGFARGGALKHTGFAPEAFVVQRILAD